MLAKAAKVKAEAVAKSKRHNMKAATRVARHLARNGQPMKKRQTFDAALLEADDLLTLLSCAVGTDEGVDMRGAFYNSPVGRPMDTAGEQLLRANVCADETHHEKMESVQRVAALFGFTLILRDDDEVPIKSCPHAFWIAMRIKALLEHHESAAVDEEEE